MRPHRSALVLAALLGCGTPGEPSLPSLGDGALHLFGILDPDSASQLILATPIDNRALTDVVGELAEVLPNGSARLVAISSSDPARCSSRYGFIFGSGSCLRFDGRVSAGRRYRITVRSPGGPPASAVADVPDDFTIQSLAAIGDPPGTESLRSTWTRSSSAYRYLVNVRAGPRQTCDPGPPDCLEILGPGWATTTAATRIDTTIPREDLDFFRSFDPLQFAVYAMSRPLVEYLSTGIDGPYSVLPRQNVEGGYGVIGAWTRRAQLLPAASMGYPTAAGQRLSDQEPSRENRRRLRAATSGGSPP